LANAKLVKRALVTFDRDELRATNDRIFGYNDYRPNFGEAEFSGATSSDDEDEFAISTSEEAIQSELYKSIEIHLRRVRVRVKVRVRTRALVLD
jgi:hypothetical protein